MWTQSVRALAALMVLAAVTIEAASPSATVTWVAPSQYTDGSAIANGDLDHYTLSWSPAGANGATGSLSIPATKLTAAVPVACGQVNFTLTVTTGAKAKYPNATSGAVGPVLFDSKVSCAPNPPSGLAVH